MYNVIIPTYNERENICVLLRMVSDVLREEGKAFKIIVVDDSSPDGTHEAVESLGLPNVCLLLRKKKLGLGSAYRAALEHCEHPFTVVMDGDLSHDPMYIKDMIRLQKKGADIVVGSRYSKEGGVYGWSIKRKIISLGANNLARTLLNMDVSDLTGSFRLYKTEVFKLLVKESVSTGYSFQMELMFLAKRHNLTIAECPIVFHDRRKGQSKLSAMEMVMYFKTVVSLFFSV
ncbi:dolichol-phosphate mannosyltransferase [Encephalitozoon intestinalis ATCC 50506]|uniref:Dolichol-phosphate mannosyltransferase subunit 1 n=1 Tax=Encephalitozoon intestinalis (strain ATCC 50506) TaxID=876142 RepID=E0S6Q8_ENCIT|nr:dolichol-phosphate mannosyltransferase [Encephalitozoon intestinalis ATCC 50506]ADM11393.1 dolichol-phosphate mannosyltransferase [Encephalitozoon intestinalis ATCC 50506]UTX45084.1 dolichol-phosphate mannosyltransferase [Encephalitozoon intestinalis]